jgi:hypothetical protein
MNWLQICQNWPFLGVLDRDYDLEGNKAFQGTERVAKVILKELGVINGKLYF